MRLQEVSCFSEALPCAESQITVTDLIGGPVLDERALAQVDVVLLGGSGDFSVAEGGPWWDAAADTLRLLHQTSKPTFASCWGFQALAQALGGHVVTDLNRAELGTISVQLTEDAIDDPVFGPLEPSIDVQMGHQDIVERLPSDAVCLASSDHVTNEALTFRGKPIYGTQFHPELSRQRLIERVVAYPQYIKRIAGMELDEFVASCGDTPRATTLLRRFIDHVFA